MSRTAASPLTAAGGASEARVSADGSRVAFESDATTLVPGQSDVAFTSDVFLYDLAAESTVLASRGAAGPTTTTNRESFLEGLSADGARVAFRTDAAGVLVGQVDTNAADDVYLFDAGMNTVTLVSHVPGLPLWTGNGASWGGATSGDGTHVAFVSEATNLVGGQTGGGFDAQVFLAEIAFGTTTLVSHALAAPTAAGNGFSDEPRVDSTGSAVAFESWATDLVPGPAVFGRNVYVFERASGANTRVSVDASALPVGGWLGGLSEDGRYVAYESYGNPGFIDDNFAPDVFVYDRASGTTRLISASGGAGGTTANGESSATRPSADGSHVAFVSIATDAVAGLTDTNAAPDVFVRGAGATLLVSRREPSVPPGTAMLGGTYGGAQAVSDDGRVVAFRSSSLDIVPGFVGSSNQHEGYVFDRLTGAIALLSRAPGTLAEGGGAYDPIVSADGRFAAFGSFAELAPGQGGSSPGDVYLYERATGAITLASHAAGAPTASANGTSYPRALSADGRYVLLVSYATDLVAGQADTNAGADLFLYDRLAATATLVSRKAGMPATTSQQSFSFFNRAELSADGRWVVYVHQGTDLVPGQVDGNNLPDVFVFDRVSGAAVLASHSSASTSTAGNGWSDDPSVSADGAWVTFRSQASDLVPGQVDPNITDDVFLFERATGGLRLVTHADGSPATAADGGSDFGRLSRGGRYVAFHTLASNVVAGVNDVNGGGDVYLYDRVADAALLVSHAAGQPLTTGDRSSAWPSLSADGAWVGFQSYANDLVPGQVDAGWTPDAFRYSRALGESVLASRKAGTASAAAGGLFSRPPQLSGDGTALVFTSMASDLVPGDFNLAEDTFHFSAAHAKGDLNDDLDTDLVWRSLTQPVHRVWTLDGDANRLAEVDVVPDQTSLDWRLVGVDDFNADLKSDLAFRNVTTGAVEFWFMDGVTRQGAPVPLGAPAPAPAWQLAATGDFNADGKPDLVWRHTSTQLLQIWTLDGVNPTGTLTPSPSQAVDANWSVVAALDLNLDGHTDFLWYNQTSGRIVRWLMNAQVQRILGDFTTPMQAGDANWKVVAGGDYGVGPGGLPGTRDIVWRNDTSGRLVVWHMDTSGTRTAGRFTNPAAPADALGWSVAGPR